MHLGLAVDGSAGDELERWMKSGEHDRHRIVRPGVDMVELRVILPRALRDRVARPREAGCGDEQPTWQSGSARGVG